MATKKTFADYKNLSPEERWARVGELLYKGICLLEMKKNAGKAAPIKIAKQEYGLTEASKLIGISKRTIQRWVAIGKIIPKRKPNGYLILSAEQIEQAKEFNHYKHGPWPIVPTVSNDSVSKPPQARIPERESHDVGEVTRKKLKSGEPILLLQCPNDRKKLAEVPDDYFDAPEGRDFYRNKKKLFIRCNACKTIISF